MFEDRNDRWVRARPVWNQHAYAVTHVADDGTIPMTSAWEDNWTQSGMNDFRTKVSGAGAPNATADLTVAPRTFTCSGSGASLSAMLCNRGGGPVGSGIEVGFFVDSTSVCTESSAVAVLPGECVVVPCEWAAPPSDAASAVDVRVVADPGGSYSECEPGNNEATVSEVYCP